jgi:tetratricopeptide (TPR) repeat protein
MLRGILAILISFASISVFAQKAEFDSIVNLLENHPEHDTTRVLWLMELQKYSVFDDAEDFLPYMQEALEISEKIEYGAGIGNALNGLGVYHFKRSDYEVALDYVLRSIDVLDSLGLEDDLILPYNNLAMINSRLEHYEEAQEAYRFIIKQLEPNGPSMQLAAVNNNLGISLYAEKKFAESLPYFEQVVSIATELKFPPGIALGQINWAKALNDLEQPREALIHAQAAYQVSSDIGMKTQGAAAMRELGRAYSLLGEHDKAIAFHDSTVQVFREVKQKGELFPSLFYQSEAYEKAGKHAKALEIFQEFHELQDSVHSEETKNITEQMRAKFETDQAVKDKQLAELEAEKSAAESARNRNLLFAAIGFAVLILVIGFLYVNRLQAQKKAQMLQVESDLRESRMKAIRSQLNPHFIFNALNSIQYLFYSGDKKTASQFMGDFATLMRNVLDMSSKAEVTIAEEKKMLSHYLDLERMRMENAFDYSFEIDEALDAEQVKLPTMLLQPYVENAVKHALQGIKEGGNLTISISKKKSDLLVKIEDNGVGLNPSEKDNSHKSFSTDANAERVRMINEGRKQAVGVQLQDLSDLGKGNGTRVTINIPLA